MDTIRTNAMTRMMVMVVAATLLASGLTGCAQDGPELPPAESMSMDISAFSGNAKSDAPGLKTHFNAAALRVWWLNTSLVLHLAVPRLVLAAALSAPAEFADGVWTWSFDAKHGAKSVNATLAGRFESKEETGDTLELEMRVTCTHCKVPTDDFLWYTGTFELGKRKGHWQLFNPEIKQDDKTFVRIDWEVTDTTHRTLTFTNKRTDGHEDAGDIIAYKRDGDSLSVTVHDESKKLDYSAEIDVATNIGWLKVPDFNKGEKACWDGERKNVACP